VIAYCGPGRRLRTALILLLDGTGVPDAIEETPHLPDPDMIILAGPAVFGLPPFGDLLPPPRPDPPLTWPPPGWPRPGGVV
jgi:hypothetical protein